MEKLVKCQIDMLSSTALMLISGASYIGNSLHAHKAVMGAVLQSPANHHEHQQHQQAGRMLQMPGKAGIKGLLIVLRW
jgi:hypothetical protein